jgi:hypothetical protein
MTNNDGTTKKTTDWLGREKEEHFDSSGNKIGETRFTKDWTGKTVQEHFNEEGEETGTTKAGSDWLGNARAEHFDQDGNRIGTSRDGTTWTGRPVQDHYDVDGQRVGRTQRSQDWLGRNFKEHQGRHFKAEPSSDDFAAEAGGAGESSSGSGTSISDKLVGGIVILFVLAVAGMVVNLFGPPRGAPTNRTGGAPTARTPARPIRQNVKRLLPVDQGMSDPSFAQFRQALMETIDRKDRAALLGVVSPKIVVGFGGQPNTVEEFARAWHLDSDDSPVWQELKTIMTMGGGFLNFQGRREFQAPYVSSAFPSNLDAFTYSAIIAPRVKLHVAPSMDSQSIAVLSYDLVKVQDWTQDRKWIRVVSPSGAIGYVASSYVRSPIDLRATFERIDGQWMMVGFFAGD